MSENLPDLYIAEKIVDKRMKGGKIEYKVKWENYSDTQNTWEPVRNLSSVVFLIEEYEANLDQKRKNKLETNGIFLSKLYITY